MALLTSPDNIPTPENSENYALTTDLATMADGVQDALIVRANYYIGTTAERTAALSDVPEGGMWFDTDTDIEYRKVSSAWSIWSGIVSSSFTAASGYTASATTELHYTFGVPMLYVSGSVSKDSGNLSRAVTLGTFANTPLGGEIRFSVAIGNASGNLGSSAARVQNDGTFQLLGDNTALGSHTTAYLNGVPRYKTA